MYKGSSALLAHALLTAHAHGVLPQVLDDLGDSFPRQIDRAARMLAVSATKADRYVGEMREIAATQASVGLTPALFEAMAEVYEAVARSAIAAEAPEAIPAARSPTSRTSSAGSLALGALAESTRRRPARLQQCGREDLNLQEPKPTGT